MSNANQIIVELKNATEKESRVLVLDIHERLVRTTPVDTGWASNNWVPTIGVPTESPVGRPGHLSLAPITKGIADVLKWTFKNGAAFVTNNVPYIQKLNSGSSKQAPSGFVEKAIQAATATANRKKLS